MSNDNLYILGNSGKLMKFDAQKIPVIKEEKRKEYAIYGTDKEWYNKQPQYYNWLYNSSSKHNAIVNSKNRFICGQGLEYDPLGLDDSKKLDAQSFVHKVNTHYINKKISLDRIIQGGFCVEMVVSEDGETIYPYHIEFANVRVSKKEYDEDGKEKPTQYFYTCDWNTRKPEINPDYTVFEEFTFDNDGLDKNKRYLFYYKDYNPDERIYPLPEYVGGVPYISADVEVGNFVYNNVAHGFTAGLLVNFYNGDPTPEQKRSIEKRWDLRNHGSDNAGKPILSFNELDSQGVEVTPLNANGQDDRYNTLNDQIRDEIFTSHETDPILIFGQTGEGGFSNDAGEKRVAYEYFKVSYVEPNQKTLEMFWNAVIRYNEGGFTVKIKPLAQIKPELDPTMILELMGRELMAKEYLGIEVEPQVTVEQKKEVFSVDEMWRGFETCGIKDEDCELLEERITPFGSIPEAIKEATKFKAEFATRKEIGLLSMLIDGLSPKEIQDSMKITEPEYNEIVNKLTDEGLYEDGEVTSQGRTEVEQEVPFVVYKYAVRPDAPPLKTESRPFCKNLMRLSRNMSWTIEDINNISAQEGRDVFATRGGWYHNPNTGVNTPFCRHIWVQRLVRRK